MVLEIGRDYEEFTPENDFATPTFKLKRPLIVKHFSPELEGMYTE
ncbi:hypothetical protein PR003_g32209 [Phytophthora rubi]|nr:hypothetical protein PR003_g32209 [Phytophthora rubi]